MECKKDRNISRCACSYPGCPRKGLCCDCIRHHLENRELPGCCFDRDAEKTYDRSFDAFVRMVQEGGGPAHHK